MRSTYYKADAGGFLLSTMFLTPEEADIQTGLLTEPPPIRPVFEPTPPSLADLKAAKNEAIDLAREQANSSTFMFQGRTIAVDRLSKDDIMGAHGEWVTGQAPEGWPGGWKTKDKGPNGEPIYVPIPDQATWMAFYRAMVAHGIANFNHSQALKAQLAVATTAEEVAAVPDW